MADTFFIEGLNTLPEQVQINKEDIKTNTDNIQRLGDLSDTYHDQIHSLTTKTDTNTANIATNTTNIATNTTDIDNLSKKVYDNGTISFYLDSDKFYLKDEGSKQYLQIWYPSQNTWGLMASSKYFVFSNTDVSIEDLSLKKLSVLTEISLDFNPIRKISNSNDTQYDSLLTGKAINDTFLTKTNASNTYLTKTNASNTYLTKTDASNTYLTKTNASNTYLTKTDASNTYATMNALKPLQNSYFDADLTTAGLAKIQANATIGTSITLLKDTDFIENITNTDLSHRTVIFTLYRDDDEEVYISKNIKLNIAKTTDYYSDNDRPHIWFAGMGVIKLGSASASGNNYLCYIAYDTTSTRGLMITPVQKLN